MTDYRQIIVDFLNGDILNRRELAKAIGGHPAYPERQGDYKAAAGILHTDDNEPAERLLWRIRAGEDGDLRPLVDLLEQFPDYRAALLEQATKTIEFYIHSIKRDPIPPIKENMSTEDKLRAAENLLLSSSLAPHAKALKEIDALEAKVATLKEVLAAILDDSFSWREVDSDHHYCRYCHGYFVKREIAHAPECPVARAQALLSQE